jgi:hypothetical protein
MLPTHTGPSSGGVLGQFVDVEMGSSLDQRNRRRGIRYLFEFLRISDSQFAFATLEILI